MIAFKDLKGLMETVINWENKLSEFYDVAETILKNNESKKIIALLRENHIKNLQIIKDIHIENFGGNEWIRYVPDFNVKNLLPIEKIKRETTSKEIINYVLEFEEKTREFYSSISEIIITRNQKELFNSLAIFKDRQVFEIKKIMESNHL